MSCFRVDPARRALLLLVWPLLVGCAFANLGCSSLPGNGVAAGGGAQAGGGAAGGASANPPTSGGAVADGAGGAGIGVGGLSGVSSGGSFGSGGSLGSGGTASGGTSAGGGSGATGGAAGSDTVTRTASSFSFRHFPVRAAASGVWNGPDTPETQAITTSYDTVVLENGYLKVTLLPSYGGRILSIVHKPTGRELLYQNPMGTPYLMNQDIFYYDYLVIMGGIFPSFPEPEHGRHWNQPYELKVVSETSEAITMRMSRRDDQDLPSGVPTNYDVGRTDLLVELEVTLRAGRSNLELSTKLTNPKTTPIAKFEYWTITTLAPGSTPGDTKIPENTRILAKMEEVHLYESSWPWFGEAEERVSGEVFKWNNLSYFKNWVEQGTAFASPKYQANHSGLINYDSGAGILRVSDNVETPGLKLWTFGRESVSADLNDSADWLRPTIEMWHGVTPEFWERGTMAAGAVKQWTDRYMPTLGMNDVTSASEYGAMYLSGTETGTDTVLSAVATLTVPGQTVHATLRLGDSVLVDQDVVALPAESNRVEAKIPTSSVVSGVQLHAEFTQSGKSLLSGQIVLP